jgi:hypothetical protein
MPDKHALLSASSADKWLHCTPSARLEENIKDTAGESAAEGTLAHSFAELKARKYFFTTSMTKSKYEKELLALKKNELYSKDIDNYTDDYLDYLKDVAMSFSIRPHVDLEKPIDYSDYAPEGFGTADCIIIGGNKLRIIDFKYGKTVKVDAENNPQMRLYALGALNAYSFLFDIKTVDLHIFQPRMNNTSDEEISANDLKKWAELIVKPQAEKAFKGEGDCIAGEWCDSHFCKCRGNCRAYLSQMKVVQPQLGKLPPLLSDSEVGKALTLASNIKKWYTQLEKYALNASLAGKHIDGWKVVEGRSNRAFTDVDKAYKVLTDAGTKKAMLYKKVPITLTECEKLIGKKDFSAMLGDYIVKPAGKPTLVPESDSRDVYNPALADFGNLETN